MKQIIVDNISTLYFITEDGRCYNTNTNKYLKGQIGKNGYISFNLTLPNGKKKRLYAHRLVALHFLDNPNPKEFTEVNHIDGNRQNNHISNLEWVSRTQNIRHAFTNNLIKTQKPVACMDNNGNVLKVYPSESEACRQLGITQGKVSRAISRKGTCKGYKWKYITENL